MPLDQGYGNHNGNGCQTKENHRKEWRILPNLSWPTLEKIENTVSHNGYRKNTHQNPIL